MRPQILTGPIVERMIERYIAEQVHHTILFPRVRKIRQLEDSDLERRTRQMVDIDISQVGIEIGNGPQGAKQGARHPSLESRRNVQTDGRCRKSARNA